MYSLFSSFVQDTLFFLKKEKSFFEESADKRKSQAKVFFGFESAANYLSQTSGNSYVDDLKEALKFLKGNPDLQNKTLAEVLADYFLNEFPQHFDHLDKAFYSSAKSQKQESLTKLFPGNTMFIRNLKNYLSINSPQEIAEEIVFFLRDLDNSPRIIVQSPMECNLQTKKEIRSYFHNLHPKSFVVFHINPQLIGGIRFFVDGKVDDLSWFSKVQAISNLTVKL